MSEDVQNILKQIQTSSAGIEEIQAALEKQKAAGLAYDVEGRTAALQKFEESLTEQGLAETFVSLIDGTLRYVSEQKSWVYWSDERWHLDRDGEVFRLFKQMIRHLRNFQEDMAQDLMHQPEEAWIKKLSGSIDGWIKIVQTRSRIENILTLVRQERGITTPITEFDRKGRFLGVANGVVDLRTGQLVTGDPAYLMMKSCPVAFEEGASCPYWKKFLFDVMDGDHDKVEFLQQIAGSCLISGNKQKLFVLQGSGANGKSTFTTMLQALLGTADLNGYCATTNPRVFTHNSNTPEYFLADLKGARGVIMSESESGKILQDTLVKQVVDTEEGLVARYPGGIPFSFNVTGTILMSTNHLPKVIATDNGTWRRLCVVQFNRVFSEAQQDRTLVDERLKPELAGILNWAIEGAKRYLANGQKFDIPEVIARETGDWREGEDRIGLFISERMLQDGGKTKMTDFYLAYSDWCSRRGHSAPSQPEVKKRLLERHIEVVPHGSGGTDHLFGWSLKAEDDNVADLQEVKDMVENHRKKNRLVEY